MGLIKAREPSELNWENADSISQEVVKSASPSLEFQFGCDLLWRWHVCKKDARKHIQWDCILGLPLFCCWEPWDYHAKNSNLASWRWGTTKREVPATDREVLAEVSVLWVRPSETTEPQLTQPTYPTEFWAIIKMDYFKPLKFRVACYSAKDSGNL